MNTAKEEVRRILDQVSEDASLEDIQYHIYVCQKIERGLKDVSRGRLLSQKEVEKRMQRWLGKSAGRK
jgi:predicted transcriptional regulator